MSDDGQIFAKFLPPKVTSPIQPIDHGLSEALKRQYKRKLLSKLMSEDQNSTSVINFLKATNLKHVVDMVVEAWDETEAPTPCKSCQITPLDKASATSSNDCNQTT